MNLAKQAALSLFANIEERRQFTGYYNKIVLPPTPRGSQSLENAPQRGAMIRMGKGATRKEGVPAFVLRTYEQNGFVYVETDCCGVQRLQDVIIEQP
jgi:hypothetical protein